MRRDKVKIIGGKLPEDSVLIETRGSWEIYYSASERAVLVQTNDYHPGILKLTESDLCHLRDIATK
jgi:hypothetical protein